MSMPERYDVLVSEQGKGDKTYYTRIGVAFVNQDYSISVKLKALPLGGELYLAIPRPKDGEAPRRGGQQRGKSSPQRAKFKVPNYPKTIDEAFGEDGGDGFADEGGDS